MHQQFRGWMVVASVALLAGCGGDQEPGTCEPGSVVCEGSVAIACGEDGEPEDGTECATSCLVGVGCTTCVPGARQCAEARAPEVCVADGSGWAPDAVCEGDGVFCSAGTCRDLCAEAATEADNVGCDFWPVTLSNRLLDSQLDSFPFAVVFANPHAFPVRARISGAGLASEVERELAPNATTVLELPWVGALANLLRGDQYAGNFSSLVRNGAYHVLTDAPVTMVQFNPLTFEGYRGRTLSYTNDASLLFPATALGDRYLALGYAQASDDTRTDNETGEVTVLDRATGLLAVVATSPGTTEVDVTLRGDVWPGDGVTVVGAGTTTRYRLEAGDVLQFIGRNAAGDLTGSEVVATQPVAVFAGNDCTRVPVSADACDHLEEQILPETSWGRRYAVTEFADRPLGTPSIVRVLASRDGTRVTGAIEATLDRGEFLDTELFGDGVVEADEPILVGQFMVGSDYFGPTENVPGDPSFVLAVPVEQYRVAYQFVTPSTYTQSFVTVVGPVGTPLLDGVALDGPGRAIAGSMLRAWSVELAPGPHRLEGSSPVERFGIQVYGVAQSTSYAYPGGLDLRAINPLE